MDTRDLRSQDVFLKNISIEISLLVLGVLLPAILLVFVQWGWSEIIEEIAKGIVVIFLASLISRDVMKVFWATMFGVLFGISEAVFYAATSLEVGNQINFVQRLLTTIPLHGFTTVLVIVPVVIFRTKKAGILGIIFAILVHLFFNHSFGL